MTASDTPGSATLDDAEMGATAHSMVDTRANRDTVNYSTREQALRISWMFGQWLLRFSPRPWFAWRRFVLRMFGAKVGAHVHVYPSARIYMPWNVVLGDWSAVGEDAFVYSLGRVTLGRAATVSYRAHLCGGTHDFTDKAHPLLKEPIIVEEGAWIGTDAFIGPNVTIGAHAIVGARAVVTQSVPTRHVVVGNPARTIRIR